MRKGDTIRGKIEYVKFPNKGIFHKNTAARKISRLTKAVNAL